jgi:hypothetical protein
MFASGLADNAGGVSCPLDAQIKTRHKAKYRLQHALLALNELVMHGSGDRDNHSRGKPLSLH